MGLYFRALLCLILFPLSSFADGKPPVTPVNPNPPPKPVRYVKYYVWDYPKIPGQTCVQAAQAVGQRLTQIAHAQGYPELRIWNVRCENDKNATYNFRIVYEASEILPVVSTDDDKFKTGDSTGTYRSREACEHDLHRGYGEVSQIEFYRRATGLEPVVAYCKNTAYFGWSAPYKLHIESFGQAKLKNFHYYGLMGAPATDPNEILAEIYRNAAVKKLYINTAAIGRDAASSYKLRLYYYAPNRLGFSFAQNFGYPSVDDCLALVPEVRKAYASIDDQPLAVFCSGGWINVFRLANKGVAFFEAPQPYNSFKSCWADRARVIDYYKGLYDWDIRHGICSVPGGGDVRMTLFRKVGPPNLPGPSGK